MCSHVHLYEVDHFRLECMCRQLGAVVCGQKGLKKLTESSLNLNKLGVEPRLGILSCVGGELLGRQLLQMQIDFFLFFIYVLRLTVLICDLVVCICLTLPYNYLSLSLSQVCPLFC